MVKCFFARLFGCNARSAPSRLPGLVRAVNKLNRAAGNVESEFEYDSRQDVGRTIEAVTAEIKAVAAKIDRERLEWVANCDSLNDSDKELAALRETLSRMERDDTSRRERISFLEKDNLEPKEMAARLEAEKSALPNASAAAPAPCGSDGVEADYEALAVSLITFRDQLLYFKSEFEQADNPQAVRLLGSLIKETGRFMTAAGVRPIEEAGALHTDDQVVSGTTPTEDPALHETVADSFRPGYRIRGALYRPQEVVIYVRPQSADADQGV